jgi:chromosome transmission fidelity protein 1
MTSESTDVPALLEHKGKDDFHHPYTPYDVQLQFMRVAYDVLSRGNGQVGILESPTGTVRTCSFHNLEYLAVVF